MKRGTRPALGIVVALITAGLGASPVAQGAAPPQPSGAPLEEIVVPLDATGPIPVDLTLEANKTYTFRASGTATLDIDDVNDSYDQTQEHDALYCFESSHPDYCKPPYRYANIGFDVKGDEHVNTQGLDQWAGKTGQVPYSSDNVYQVEVTKTQDTEFDAYSYPGLVGSCELGGSSCTGSYTLRIWGSEESPNKVKEVRYTFTHGGRPKGAPAPVADVRTTGKGWVQFTKGAGGSEVVDYTKECPPTQCVTRQMDFLARDQDTGEITRTTREMKFRVMEDDGTFTCCRTNLGSFQIHLDLLAVSSTDPDCPVTEDGVNRTAQLIMTDWRKKKEKPDSVFLEVDGCPHHNDPYKNSKRVIVKTVIVVKDV